MMTWEQAVVWLRQQPDQAELIKASYFDDPLLSAAQRYYQSAEWQAVQKLLPTKRGKVLDLGAGRGISSYAFAKEGWQVVSLEPDPSGIVGANAIRNLSKESGLTIEVLEQWGEQLPFSEAAFDLVYCRAVLHHARDLKQLCSEIARVLKPGGRLFATREHVISKADDLKIFLERHPLHHLCGGEHAYLLNEYIAMITQAGMKLERLFNPFQSNINLFPETPDTIKTMIAKRLRLPSTKLIPNFLLGFFGQFSNAPGRLYTFIATNHS